MLLISFTPQVISSKSLENNPPYIPSNPNPEDGEINVDIHETLSWIGGDPDENDTVAYDVYFGDINPPPLVVSNQSETTYDPGTMNYDTLYYWQIIAWDNHNASSIGPLWYFTTKINNPPVFGAPSPTNGSTIQPLTFTWSIPINDPDGDSFDWTIECSNGQTSIGNDDTNGTKTLVLSDLEYSTMYTVWVNATDSDGSGLYTRAWYTFTTLQPNQPPYEPSNPVPVNGAKNVDVNTDLKWSGGDPDDDPVRYDIFFGATSMPPLVASNYIGTTYDPGIMDFNTTYCWKIISYDIYNASSEGMIWNFTTEEWRNSPPIRPNVDGVRGLLVPDVEYEYNIITTDPNNDDVFYFIDWGDGTFVDWFGPYESGTNTTKTHTWPRVTRMYEIKVKAKDIYGEESEWGTMKIIVISLKSSTRSFSGNFIVRIIDRFPILEQMIRLLPLINRMINLR